MKEAQISFRYERESGIKGQSQETSMTELFRFLETHYSSTTTWSHICHYCAEIGNPLSDEKLLFNIHKVNTANFHIESGHRPNEEGEQ